MMSKSELNIDELKAAALKATACDLDTAQIIRDEDLVSECPFCSGDGSVQVEKDYCNIDGFAVGVNFYGIGNEHGANEAYFRLASPKNIISLVDRIKTADHAIYERDEIIDQLRQKYQREHIETNRWKNRAELAEAERDQLRQKLTAAEHALNGEIQLSEIRARIINNHEAKMNEWREQKPIACIDALFGAPSLRFLNDSHDYRGAVYAAPIPPIPAQQSPAVAVPEFNGWYCAQCQSGVDPSEVTFHETHTVCGRYITDDVPPASPRITEQDDRLAFLVVKALHNEGGPHESVLESARRIVKVIAHNLPNRITEQDALDLRRYRWLRDSDNFPMDDIPDDSIWDHLCEKDRADFDEFIDLMMSNEDAGAAELLNKLNANPESSDFDECSASGQSCEYVVAHGDDNEPCAQCRYCGKAQPESGVYSNDPLACTGCVSGCFRCASPIEEKKS